METVIDKQVKFKFKSLKFHSSKMWLNDSKRKYRTVFHAPNVSFIYFELTIINKLLDSQDWNANVIFKGFDYTSLELFSHNVSQLISKKEDTAIIRGSWGVPEAGTFWTKGTYKIEAYIDEVKAGEGTFFIIDSEGEDVNEEYNPWFSLTSIKLYEGTASDVKYGERKYLKEFDALNTRYIYIEVEAQNKYANSGTWPGEFMIRIRNNIGELVAEISDLFSYTKNYKVIRFSRGWGSDTPGTWFEGHYKVELIFLDYIIGIINFTIGKESIENTEAGKYSLPDKTIPKFYAGTVKKQLTEAVLMQEINELIGLEAIKQKIKDLYEYIKFIQVRKDKGLEDENSLLSINAIFTGNPGTGKTVTAKLLGKIFFDLGLLSKGHVYEVDRTMLIGEYIGHTAPKTKEAIKKARGGILFIDEAYSLAREAESDKDFGKEAIEIIVKELSDGPGDISIICAGYPAEMEIFLNSNPGLKSRFNHFFQFPDYNPQELLEIGKYTAEKRDVKLSAEAEELLYKKLVTAYRDRDRSFGNARYVNSIIEEAKMNLALRVIDDKTDASGLDDEALSIINLEDMKNVFLKKEGRTYEIPVDNELLHESLNELNSMIGIENIKQEVQDIVKLVQYYKEIGKDVRKVFQLHSIFTGNPGTGKTTVARIFSRIFRALGIIERGHLVEVDREGLVAGFVGQTAIKTSKKIDEAIGGVLFIDEAYALSQGHGSDHDFGAEALEVILKRMEDRRGEFVVICAGYTDNMEDFLRSNPGLKSRFDKKFHFNDYSAEELFAIMWLMFDENEVVCNDDAALHLKKYINAILSHKDKFFGNARDIRKAVDIAVKNQNLRLAGIPAAQRTNEMISMITLEDVKELYKDMKVDKSFGFKPD